MTESSALLAGCTLLVVEDEFLLAETLCDALASAGARVLGPIGTADAAVAFLAEQSVVPDCVVLDVNLHGEPSYRVADAMVARNVRVVFLTGYGREALDAAYRNFPHCEKPFDQITLFRLLVKGR